MKSSHATDTEICARQEALLRAAEEVFTEHGYARATVDEIALRAGIAKGSVYTYFKSKQQLFKEVFSHHYPQREAELVAQLSKESSATNKLKLLFEAWYDSHATRAHSPLTMEFWQSAMRQEDGVILEVLKRRHMFWRDMIAQIVAEGMEQGVLNSRSEPAVTAAILMAMFDGLLIQSMLHVGINLDRTIFDKLVEGIFESLTVQPDTEKE